MKSDDPEAQASFVRCITAVAAIQKATGGRVGIKDEMACPICGGILRYGVATNGHVRAACQTEGCVSFVQ